MLAVISVYFLSNGSTSVHICTSLTQTSNNETK